MVGRQELVQGRSYSAVREWRWFWQGVSQSRGQGADDQTVSIRGETPAEASRRVPHWVPVRLQPANAS